MIFRLLDQWKRARATLDNSYTDEQVRQISLTAARYGVSPRQLLGGQIEESLQRRFDSYRQVEGSQ